MASDWEEQLAFQIRALRLPLPSREFRFHPERKWRFDFAWPEKKIAVEFEGAVFIQGRHTRGSGFIKDCEKYNNAILLGWRVLRFTSKEVQSGEALQMIEILFRAAGMDPQVIRKGV